MSFACKVVRQTKHSVLPDITGERDTILAISQAHHPNIVEVIDTWMETDAFTTTCFIQMELCQGDLASYLRKRYASPPIPLSLTEIWSIFRQIMYGLEHIHSAGVVHRDLKPKNGNCQKNLAEISALYERP